MTHLANTWCYALSLEVLARFEGRSLGDCLVCVPRRQDGLPLNVAMLIGLRRATVMASVIWAARGNGTARYGRLRERVDFSTFQMMSESRSTSRRWFSADSGDSGGAVQALRAHGVFVCYWMSVQTLIDMTAWTHKSMLLL